MDLDDTLDQGQADAGARHAGIEPIEQPADLVLVLRIDSGAVVGELDTTPDLLATTDQTIEEVADGAVRYAGSVGKLLG